MIPGNTLILSSNSTVVQTTPPTSSPDAVHGPRGHVAEDLAGPLAVVALVGDARRLGPLLGEDEERPVVGRRCPAAPAGPDRLSGFEEEVEYLVIFRYLVITSIECTNQVNPKPHTTSQSSPITQCRKRAAKRS